MGYHMACCHMTRLIEKCRMEHISQKMSDASGNLRKLWQAINSILHPPLPPVAHPSSWAQTVPDYFCSKVADVKRQTKLVATDLDYSTCGSPRAALTSTIGELYYYIVIGVTTDLTDNQGVVQGE